MKNRNPDIPAIRARQLCLLLRSKQKVIKIFRAITMRPFTPRGVRIMNDAKSCVNRI